ncbi:hypothetical protein Axi01nite_13060 [Actinoplanes xinjiangensis]|nr:hypothetical protein Axi01nite_13060 [Actinoplanes xinjiangensis]
MAVIFTALLLLAVAALAMRQFGGADEDRKGGAGSVETPEGGGVMVPGTSESDPARLVYTMPPLGAIRGIDVQAVAGAWEKRWKVALKKNAETHEQSTIVDYPAGGGRLHLVITTTVDGAEAESVRCILEHGTKKVDRKLLDGVVNDCLAPALEQSERAEVGTWLNAQDYKATTDFQTRKKSMPRFDLTVDVMAGSLRAGVVGRP